MARNTSRFNKILNFIGLVDEQDDVNMDYDQGRPSGSSTYSPSSRRAPQSSARPVRSAGYDEPRYNAPRYEAGRGDYARNRDRELEFDAPRDYAPRDYSPRDYSTGRERDYAPQQGGYRGGDYTRQPRQDYDRISSRPDYEPRPQPSRQAPGRGASRADATRNDYYSQRQSPPPARGSYAPPLPEPKNNVITMHGDPRAQTVIYYLHALEECRDVINDLLDNKTVLLNLEDMDERLIQRGIDTLCGAAFALNATLRKASDKTYLIAPNSVSVAQPGDSDRLY